MLKTHLSTFLRRERETIARLFFFFIFCYIVIYASPYGPQSRRGRFAAINVVLVVAALSLLSKKKTVYEWMTKAVKVGGTGRRATRDPQYDSLTVVSGFLLLCLTLLFLQLKQPFYFTQDDNHSSFLPVILQGCRGLLAGVFPTWNPFQYMGAPTTSMGLYSLTYPPLHLSYAIATFLLRNEYLTIEVYCILHIVACFIITFRLLRRLDFATFESTGAAFCFAFSGYHLVAGRSWYYMLPVAVFSPWLILKLIELKQSTRLKKSWAISTGLLIGMWFHAGNVQMWTYGMITWSALALLWCTSKNMEWKKLVWLCVPLALGMAIALPLLTFQATEARHRVMNTSGYGVRGGVLNMVLPPPFVESGYPGVWGQSDRKSVLYFSGGVFFVGFLFSLVTLTSLILGHAKVKNFLKEQSFTIVALIIFLFAFGDAGALWSIVSWIPPFNKFAKAFKLLGYFSLFSILSGLYFLRSVSSQTPKGQILSKGIVSLGVILTLINCSQATYSFYNYRDRPYPELPEPYQEFSQNTGATQRVYAVGPIRSPKSFFTLNFVLNYPSVYNLLSMDGYDTTMTNSPEMIEIRRSLANDTSLLEEYGVKWVVADPKNLPPNVASSKWKQNFEWGDYKVFEIPNPRPLVFDAKTKAAQDFKTRADGIDIWLAAESTARTIVANFVRRPWIKAFDGRGKELPVSEDSLQRMVVSVPANVSQIAIRYVLPWTTPLLISLILVVFCSGVLFSCKGRRLLGSV